MASAPSTTPPGQRNESPVMTVWPTIAATAAGRWVGRLCALRLGYGFFTLGKLMAPATIPLSLAVFGWQLMPWVCRRYALTSRRILIQKGLSAAEGPWLDLRVRRRRGARVAGPGVAPCRRPRVSPRPRGGVSPGRGLPARGLPPSVPEGADRPAELPGPRPARTG